MVVGDESLFSVIHGVDLISGLAGQINAQFLKGLLVYLRKDHRGMHLTARKLIKLLQRPCRKRRGCRADRKHDQYLIGMQSGIFVVQVIHLQMLYRLDYG